jgi:carbon-monoxide dehydrogenase large subunit
MDYLLPVASDIPRIEIEHLEIPAPDIPGGLKGAGEAGTIAAAAVVASAVSDALGVEIDELPLDPEAVWRLGRGPAARSRPVRSR